MRHAGGGIDLADVSVLTLRPAYSQVPRVTVSCDANAARWSRSIAWDRSRSSPTRRRTMMSADND